jgi:hypothetical protein
MKELPHISKYNEELALYVDGKPWFCFAGEVHNSSASNIHYFKAHVLEGIEALNLNTLILPVYWEQIEPIEGQFCFDVMDAVLAATSEKKLRVILLWFGLWKNGISTYVPQWMKLDRKQYPFIKKQDGSSTYSITPLCAAAVEKDGNAFLKLMAHLRETDAERQTVIAVQVENEVGSLQTDRDYSAEANQLFSGAIPEEIAEMSGIGGTWELCFGDDAAESFMCYYYAKAVNEIVSRGKEQYALPMVVNAWLAKADDTPGKYPSGGPMQRMIDMWRALAPSIDLCVPDIYLEEFKEICDIYAKQGLLIIPEARQDVRSISNVIYTIAAYPSACFSPFGIDDFLPANKDTFIYTNIIELLGISKEAFKPFHTQQYLSKIYGDLSSAADLIMEKRSCGKVHAFIQSGDEESTELAINDISVQIRFLKGEGIPRGAGFFLELNENEWLIYGIQFMAHIQSVKDNLQFGKLSFESGHFDNSNWVCDRVMNGDEQYVIIESSKPQFLRLKWHLYR